MAPSMRMVFVAGALMLALLAAIVSSVSIEPVAFGQARTMQAGHSTASVEQPSQL